MNMQSKITQVLRWFFKQDSSHTYIPAIIFFSLEKYLLS